MVFLTSELWFPDPTKSMSDGLLAIGGDLRPDRLLLAYSKGIFPWFMEYGDVYWYCPPERMVLFPGEIHVSHSMKQLLSSGKFSLTEDQAFEDVIRGCALPREGKENATWINDEFIDAYMTLHQLGHAHSVEVWVEDELAGGLYGVAIGKVFCGESMFSKIDNASKVGLIHLCHTQKYSLIDCQVATPHLETMGARLIARDKFLELLSQLL